MSRTKVLQRVVEVATLAEQLYDVPIKGMTTKFDLRGKAAGKASVRVQKKGDEMHIWACIRINRQAMKLDLDDMLDDTVPHEIAHIVCMLKPSLGRDHDAGWVRVCQALGGTGKQYHNLPLRGVQREWRYVATCGTEFWLPTVVHKRVQAGRNRKVRGTGGRLTAESFTGDQR